MRTLPLQAFFAAATIAFGLSTASAVDITGAGATFTGVAVRVASTVICSTGGTSAATRPIRIVERSSPQQVATALRGAIEMIMTRPR